MPNILALSVITHVQIQIRYILALLLCGISWKLETGFIQHFTSRNNIEPRNFMILFYQPWLKIWCFFMQWTLSLTKISISLRFFWNFIASFVANVLRFLLVLVEIAQSRHEAQHIGFQIGHCVTGTLAPGGLGEIRGLWCPLGSYQGQKHFAFVSESEKLMWQ